MSLLLVPLTNNDGRTALRCVWLDYTCKFLKFFWLINFCRSFLLINWHVHLSHIYRLAGYFTDFSSTTWAHPNVLLQKSRPLYWCCWDPWRHVGHHLHRFYYHPVFVTSIAPWCTSSPLCTDLIRMATLNIMSFQISWTVATDSELMAVIYNKNLLGCCYSATQTLRCYFHSQQQLIINL